MYPYQLSKVMADQRISDRVAAGERHRLIAAATTGSTATTGSSTRLKDLVTRMLAPLHVRHRASARLTATSGRAGARAMTPGPGTGPIGCSA